MEVSPPEWAGVRAQVGGVSLILLNKFLCLNLVGVRAGIISTLGTGIVFVVEYWYWLVLGLVCGESAQAV